MHAKEHNTERNRASPFKSISSIAKHLIAARRFNHFQSAFNFIATRDD